MGVDRNLEQDAASRTTASRLSIPVAVVLERTIDQSKKWVVPSWSLIKVISGRDLQQNTQPVIIHQENGVQRSLHGGLKLDLFKDGGEGYWYNLLSNDPYLFVVCEGEPNDMEIRPYYVTVNHDEANGFLETDTLLLSSPMPVGLRELLEHYVVDHYHPTQRKKRKRTDWMEDSLYAENIDRNGGKKSSETINSQSDQANDPDRMK